MTRFSGLTAWPTLSQYVGVANQDIGPKIRMLRQRAGLTSTELAAAAGISDSALRRIERGTRWPRESTLKALGAKLGVDLLRYQATAAPASSQTHEPTEVQLALLDVVRRMGGVVLEIQGKIDHISESLDVAMQQRSNTGPQRTGLRKAK